MFVKASFEGLRIKSLSGDKDKWFESLNKSCSWSHALPLCHCYMKTPRVRSLNINRRSSEKLLTQLWQSTKHHTIPLYNDNYKIKILNSLWLFSNYRHQRCFSLWKKITVFWIEERGLMLSTRFISGMNILLFLTYLNLMFSQTQKFF